MNRFFESAARVLEVDSVDFNTEFRRVPGWCSLHAFGLLVMLENDFAAPMDIVRMREMKTVGELYVHAFIALVASITGAAVAELSSESAMGDVSGWDSVNHLRIFMEAEKRFGVRYELQEMPAVKTIADFVRAGR